MPRYNIRVFVKDQEPPKCRFKFENLELPESIKGDLL